MILFGNFESLFRLCVFGSRFKFVPSLEPTLLSGSQLHLKQLANRVPTPRISENCVESFTSR